MKKLIYLFIGIVISITLSSGITKSTAGTKSVTLRSTEKNAGPAQLKQSADIISARLKIFGIKSFEVNVSEKNGQLKLSLPDSTNISAIEGLITAKGELSFYETYTHAEISELLKPDNQLFNLGHDQEQQTSDPRVGCTTSENIKKVDDYLMSAKQVKNCKLFWGFESEKSGYCLFSLKTGENGKPLMVRSDIESVRIAALGSDSKIQIKLKPAAKSVFAEGTRRNVNKAIAIVIDNKVYSWPVVRDAIEGGEIEVTGNFTKNEVSYFPALFNTDQLPLHFRLLK